MSGQIVHIEIPADDTEKAREFWGSLFGWQFEAYPGSPSEYHMTRITEQSGAAITNMEPGKQGTRSYFDVDDINEGAARVKELGGEADDADAGAEHGLVRHLQGPPRERVRPLADRPVRPGSDRLAEREPAAPNAGAAGRSPSLRLRGGLLEDGDVELPHLQHRRHDALGLLRSGSPISSNRTFGTTCHDTPNLSFSQPHGPSSPPSERVFQYRSTSSWLSQLSWNEIGLAEGELGPAVERRERLAVQLEADRHDGARFPRPGLAVPGDLEDFRVREHRRVELRRLFAFGVEPQARSDLLHRAFPLIAVTVRRLPWRKDGPLAANSSG